MNSEVKSLSRAQPFETPWTVACTKLFRPWDFLSKSTGVGCHFLLQRIFLMQGSNPGLLYCRQTLYHLSHQTMNTMKRQNDRLLKRELPGSVGAQYATGDQWRNDLRKNEGMEPKKKRYPVVDVTGDRSKVLCCKEQYYIGTWNVRSMNQGKLKVVKQEMTRVNVDILGISEVKWTGMGEFNSDDHCIYYCRQESLTRNRSHHGQQKSPKCSAAAAAKSLQSCLTLCDPRDGSPTGSPFPGILQARTLEWVDISFSNV